MIKRYQEMDIEDVYLALDRLITTGPEQELQVVCEILSSRETRKAEKIREALEKMEARQQLSQAMSPSVDRLRREGEG